MRFGNSLVSTLQSTSETDHTRSQSLELHVQSRIAAELSRLEARETEILANIDSKITTPDAAKESEREQVKREIEGLKERLSGLPKLRELDTGLKESREKVLQCLREKETRSLDCFEEVTRFREEARRWEKAFVVQTVGREY